MQQGASCIVSARVRMKDALQEASKRDHASMEPVRRETRASDPTPYRGWDGGERTPGRKELRT